MFDLMTSLHCEEIDFFAKLVIIWLTPIYFYISLGRGLMNIGFSASNFAPL